MEVIRSSTSEITFLIDATKALINEQDFILISDSTTTPPKQYLAQVSNLVQQKSNEIRGTASILGEINIEDSTLEPCRFPIAMTSQIGQPPRGLVSKIISYHNKFIDANDQ